MSHSLTNTTSTFIAEIAGGRLKGNSAATARITIVVDGVTIRGALEDDDDVDAEMTTIREAVEHILPSLVSIRRLRRV